MTLILLLAVVVIAAFDSLNPSLFLGQFYLMTTPNPVRRIWGYIAGLLTVNYLGGVLLLGGISVAAAQFTAQFAAHLSAEVLYAGALAIGVGMLVFGLWLRVTKEPPAAGMPAGMPAGGHGASAWRSFGLGALIMLNELTTALPYLAAVERIAAAGLGWAANLLLLLLYNVVFALPLVAFLALFVRLRDRFTAQIGRIAAAVHVWTLRIFKYGALAGGVLTIGWALRGFVAG